MTLLPRRGLVGQIVQILFLSSTTTSLCLDLAPSCQQFVSFLLMPNVGIDESIVLFALSPNLIRLFLQGLDFMFPHFSLGRRLSQCHFLHHVKLSGQFIQQHKELWGIQDTILDLRQLLPRIMGQLAAFGKELRWVLCDNNECIVVCVVVLLSCGKDGLHSTKGMVNMKKVRNVKSNHEECLSQPNQKDFTRHHCASTRSVCPHLNNGSH